jgi:hypothetical protein
MGWTNGVRHDGFADAFDMAREAVRLAPSSGESWYALGEVHLLAEVEWEDASAPSTRRWRATRATSPPVPG